MPLTRKYAVKEHSIVDGVNALRIFIFDIVAIFFIFSERTTEDLILMHIPTQGRLLVL